MSVQQVFERQKYLEMTIETFGQTIKDLKKELSSDSELRQERDELADKLDSWSKEFQEGAKE